MVLGFDDKYIRTYVGAVHGTFSLLALTIGLITMPFILFASPDFELAHLWFQKTLLFVIIANAISSFVLHQFFWNKMQNWMYSTTTREAKALTAKDLQNWNYMRGYGLILCGTIPMLHALAPSLREKYCPSSFFSSLSSCELPVVDIWYVHSFLIIVAAWLIWRMLDQNHSCNFCYIPTDDKSLFFQFFGS